MENDTYAPGCEHQCSGNCRREGCNCLCGEWHGTYEPSDEDRTAADYADAEPTNIEQGYED